MPGDKAPRGGEAPQGLPADQAVDHPRRNDCPGFQAALDVLGREGGADQPQPWTPEDRAGVDEVLQRLNQESGTQGQLQAAQLECKVAARLEDELRMRACSARMTQLAPNTAPTIVYALALALKLQDWQQAERAIVERTSHIKSLEDFAALFN